MTGDTQEQKKAPTITDLIDGDEGLKSKRKLLTITSLVLLALTFSGAKVEEANTFILKLKFENQNGIAILLVLAIVFLLIRYYNYAKPYHERLYSEWTNRMMEHRYFYSFKHENDEFNGLVMNVAPKMISFEAVQHDGLTFSYRYNCSLFKRSFIYNISDANGDYEDEVSVGWKNYLNVIFYEARYRTERYFSYRENLDVLAPYALGIVAISSYFFHAELQLMLNFLAIK